MTIIIIIPITIMTINYYNDKNISNNYNDNNNNNDDDNNNNNNNNNNDNNNNNSSCENYNKADKEQQASYSLSSHMKSYENKRRFWTW